MTRTEKRRLLREAKKLTIDPRRASYLAEDPGFQAQVVEQEQARLEWFQAARRQVKEKNDERQSDGSPVAKQPAE